MHTLRLLLSAVSIVERGEPRVRFDGADLAFLLSVRRGEHEYDALVAEAEALQQRCVAGRASADLPENVDAAIVDDLLRELTECWEKRCR